MTQPQHKGPAMSEATQPIPLQPANSPTVVNDTIVGGVSGLAQSAMKEMFKQHGPVATLLGIVCGVLLWYVHVNVIAPANQDRQELKADRQAWTQAWQSHAEKDNETQGKIAEALVKIDMRLQKLETKGGK